MHTNDGAELVRPKTTPHSRLTAEEVRENWLNGDHSASGYLIALLRALRKDGWKLMIKSVDAFCAQWRISRASFYRAKRRLVEQGRIGECIRYGLVLWVIGKSKETQLEEDSEDTETPETSSIFLCEEDCLNTNAECLNAESEYLRTESECLNLENSTDLKPTHHAQSEASSTLDQLSNNSLSHSHPPRGFHPERETPKVSDSQLIKFIQSKLSRSTAIKNSPRAYAIGVLKQDREFWQEEFIKSKNSSIESNVPATAVIGQITPPNEMTEEEKRSSTLSRIQAKWNVSALRDAAIAEAKKWGFIVTPTGILSPTS